MQRFFVPPSAISGHFVTLDRDQTHQVRRVLRMRTGDRATILDNQGWAYEGVLVAGAGEASFELASSRPATGEPETQITIFQALLKGERFDWALQKCTEVGVGHFVPLVCERTVVADLDAIERKRVRWKRIIQEAAEQSGRGRLPSLGAVQQFSHTVKSLSTAQETIRLIPWEGERRIQLSDALQSRNFLSGARIEVLIGPEGGFTEEEAELARRNGITPITLGPRILRSETAGLVTAVAILCQAGEI